MADTARLRAILDEGAERIRPIADATMAEVRERMGLRYPSDQHRRAEPRPSAEPGARPPHRRQPAAGLRPVR
jgi:hypothetical protein